MNQNQPSPAKRTSSRRRDAGRRRDATRRHDASRRDPEARQTSPNQPNPAPEHERPSPRSRSRRAPSSSPRNPRNTPNRPRSHFPILGFIIWGLILGAFAAIGWQVWRWTQPMLDAPPLPQFALDRPPILPTPAPVAAEPTPTPEPTSATPERPTTVPSLLEIGQRGRVIEPIGLAIRAQPSLEGAYIGGIAFDEFLVVLETSADARWQRVRRELTGQEGWVKAGNVVLVQ